METKSGRRQAQRMELKSMKNGESQECSSEKPCQRQLDVCEERLLMFLVSPFSCDRVDLPAAACS